jgi:hypothetical protein
MTKPGVVFVGAAHEGLPTEIPSRVPSANAWAFAAAATALAETASGGPLITSSVVVGALDFDFLAGVVCSANTNRQPTIRAKVTVRAQSERRGGLARRGCTEPFYGGLRWRFSDGLFTSDGGTADGQYG